MAFLTVQNVSIKGIAAAVPKGVKEIRECEFFAPGEAEKVISLTKVERSRIVREGQCCSDLCYEAAEKLIAELGWSKQEIEALVYVSLSRDYSTPHTSALLQNRLGLSKECFAIDIPLACSGYVYGLSAISSLMQTGNIKKALLLVGEVTSIWQSKYDKVIWPLHGDGASATALEYNANSSPMHFHLGTDGSRGDAIIIPYGGVRHPITPEALEYKEIEPGVRRNGTHTVMDGMNVFAFSLKEPPASMRALADKHGVNIPDLDYLVLHQANKYMDDKIAKKFKIDPSKVPFSLMQYGNTSAGSIPLTIVVGIGEKLKNEKAQVMMCGFGSGLSWGSALVELDHIHCLPLIECE